VPLHPLIAELIAHGPVLLDGSGGTSPDIIARVHRELAGREAEVGPDERR